MSNYCRILIGSNYDLLEGGLKDDFLLLKQKDSMLHVALDNR